MATSIDELKQIDEARQELGVTRAKLCRRAGVSHSTYSKAINAKREGVREKTLEKLLSALERLKREKRDRAMRLNDIVKTEGRTAA